MSKMAYQTPPETSVDMITQFGGYNHNISISDGEFYDMENLSSDKYPLASIRGKRVKMPKTYVLPPSNNGGTLDLTDALIAENNGIYAILSPVYNNERFLYIYKYDEENSRWVYDAGTQAVSVGDSSLVIPHAPTSYVNMGAYIVMPDIGVAYNTVKHKAICLDFQQEVTLSLHLSTGVTGNSISVLMFNGSTVTSGNSEPTSPANNDWWFDFSSGTSVLKKYSESSGMWNVVPLYVVLYGSALKAYEDEWAEGAGYLCIREDDAVEIDFSYGNIGTYLEKKDNQKYWIAEKVDGTPVSTDKIVVFQACLKKTFCDTIASSTATFSTVSNVSVRLKRKMPNYDFMTECNNRLWACRYGTDNFGEPVNEIYACKLGDPTNWHYFGNTAIDSYYLSLGVGGNFTGVMTYQSNPVFFKEDSVHRIYGNYPSNYQLKTVMGYGVKAGSNKSLTELNGNVYYLSNAGVTVYQGGTPVSVSTIFGDEKYTDGIAASAGNKMYMSLKDSKNNRRLFVYDDRYDTWYRENNIALTQMFAYNSRIFCRTATDIICLSDFNNITSYESNVNWSFDTGKIGFASPLHKFINKITLRMRLALDAYASIYIQYDSDGNDTHVADIRPTGNVTTIAVPVIPHRCDHFNIRMQGAGRMELISLTKYYEETTDYD